MSPAVENSARPEDHAAANDYDSFAEAYAAETESSLINAYYTRPAILDLAGDVAGRRILDAGCGSGPLHAALRDRGGIVTGIDSSAKMLELARRRLGGDADLHLADLASPLPFPDEAFDDVVASLVLHYLEDWTAPLAELRRVLRTGGRLIVAVDHPFVHKLIEPDADYFATSRWSVEWTLGGQRALMAFWHRPLHAMCDAFTSAGFRIAVVSEPPPAPEAHTLFPDEVRGPARPSCASCSSSCTRTNPARGLALQADQPCTRTREISRAGSMNDAVRARPTWLVSHRWITVALVKSWDDAKPPRPGWGCAVAAIIGSVATIVAIVIVVKFLAGLVDPGDLSP